MTALASMVLAVALAGPAAAPLPADFEAMLARVDAAQTELQNGRAAAFKALWSRADDVTLSGGFGGRIEKGWDAIDRRLDWVATQFANGSHVNERLAASVSGDLGYVVQVERLRYQFPGKKEWIPREHRVTMVFRREPGGWRLVHRQADASTTRRAVH